MTGRDSRMTIGPSAASAQLSPWFRVFRPPESERNVVELPCELGRDDLAALGELNERAHLRVAARVNGANAPALGAAREVELRESRREVFETSARFAHVADSGSAELVAGRGTDGPLWPEERDHLSHAHRTRDARWD